MNIVGNKQAYAKSLLAVLLSLAVIFAFMPLMAGTANADEAQADVTVNGVKVHLWYSSAGASVAVRAYTGTATVVKLPDSVSYNGKVYKSSDGNTFFIEKGAFGGNTKVTKIAIPDGYEAINQDSFKGCINLKNYYFSGDNIYSEEYIKSAGIGTDALGDPISGVTVWTKEGSKVYNAITELNKNRPADKQIILKTVRDPYVLFEAENNGGNKDNGNGTDGTPVGPGASETNADKAISAFSGENDIKGSVFGLLQAKATSSSKTSVKVSWKKAGAKKFIVYGNKCGAKNKMVKLQTVTKTSVTFKTINGKKVKKGTYYKFIVLALNGNKVVSTSKSVHVATLGGKVGNDKKVIVKAKVKKKTKKVSKVSVKKGKTVKLKCKAVPQKKKLKVKRHRKIAFESSNKTIASVSSKGVVTGLKKGKCKVFAYTQNGIFKAVTVTVK